MVMGVGRVEADLSGRWVGWWAGSGFGLVLVDESGAGGVSLDRVAWPDRRDEMIIVGCALVDPAMWPVVVVVIDVLDEQRVQLVFVPDDCPVGQLVAQRSNPSFGESVRLGCSWGDSYRGDSRSSEYVVE